MDRQADIIFHNAVVKTQDARLPEVQALAIKGNRIFKTGPDKEILSLRSNRTQIIDLGGRLVLPGFIDTHFHFYEWALNYESINFSRTTSFSQMQKQISQKAGKLAKGQWVLGQGFNESDWPENKIPDRNDLDQAAPDHPVCIWRCDMHLAVANSRALALAGIDTRTVQPENGVIVKDGSGLPTGVLKELASNMIRDVIPDTDDPAILRHMRDAIADAHQLGLTSVHDIRLMGGLDGADALRAWQQLRMDDALLIRCHVALPGEMTDQAVDLGLMTGMGDDLLRIGHLKFFSDGGMGARTGWVIEKYTDAEYGMALTPVADIESAVRKADRAGLSTMVHAIGDRANREIIQMFGRVEALGRSRCRIPHRIEHVQMARQKDLDRLSALKHMAVSCQPNNLSLDISMIDMCAKDQARNVYPLKSILRTGVLMMLSSDAPVADPNPFAGIYSAVTRRRMDYTPKGGWHMEQALSIDQAVQGYTLHGAMGSGTGHLLGSITPGKLADLIVLDQNIYQADPRTIAQTRIDMTVFNGKKVHERG